MSLPIIAEKYTNSLYTYEPTIMVARWWIPDYPIMVGGSLIDSADWEHLRRDFGVTHVVNIESEHSDRGKLPDALLCEQRVPDDGAPFPSSVVNAIVEFARFAPTEAVFYVHCQMGGSRSPAAAYAVLRARYGLTAERALAAVNRGFEEKKRLTEPAGEAVAHGSYGWHPVHQSYLSGVNRCFT